MKASIRGLDELGRKIDELIRKADGPMMTAAMMTAGEVVAEEMRAQVPVDDGGLKRSIIVTVGKERRRMKHLVKIGPRYPQGAHAHLVEFGTRARQTRPRGKKALAWEGGEHPVSSTGSGAMPAKPFMRPAADASRERVRRVFYDELKKVVTP